MVQDLAPAHLVRCWRMRGTMLAGGPALVRNGCFSSSAAVARWAGSRTSRRSRKPFRDGEACGGAEVSRTGLLATGPLSCGATTGPQGTQHPRPLRLISSPFLWFSKKQGVGGGAPSHTQILQQDRPTIRQPGPKLWGSLRLKGPCGSVSGLGVLLGVTNGMP